METRFCDWHTHTNFSKDSSLSIDDYFGNRLPPIVKEIPLKGVSITDHNTLRAYTVGEAELYLEAFNARQPSHRMLKMILGVELSLDVGEGEGKQHLHFLFYHPNTEGSLKKTAESLEGGLLGDVMRRIVAQNNERHRLMAMKAASYLGLNRSRTAEFLETIFMLRDPSPETGREHLKNAITSMFPDREGAVKTLFSRPENKDESSCYVPTHEVRGLDVPYLDTLMELNREYRKAGATIALAHPWRHDTRFEYSDPGKEKDGMLIDMDQFISRLAKERLINGLEVHGYFPIPGYIRRMGPEEMESKGIPKELMRRAIDGRKFARYTGDTYLSVAKRKRLILCGGNDSHGDSKPEIAIGYDCPATDPLPYHLTGVRHTPARGTPALGIESR